MNRFIKIAVIALLVATFLMSATPTVPVTAANDACTGPNALWVATFGFGVNCLDDAGWHTYAKKTSQLQNDLIKAVVDCGKEGTLISSALGLDLTPDGKVWKKLNKLDGVSSADAMACAPNGDIWVAFFKGVAQYSDGKWVKFDAKGQLGSGQSVDLVKDIKVAADGKVWAVTSNSVAVYDGKAWTVYEKSKGFSKDFFLEKVVISPKGQVYVAHGSGVLIFDGKDWTSQENSDLSQVKTMALDSKGNLWVGTYAKGVSMYDGKTWTVYKADEKGLTTNHIRSLVIDGQDRVWVGTEWGLNVYDGKTWTAYHMHTSDLADNTVVALLVNGTGPKLPEAKTTKPGGLTGTILSGKDPLADATVELCTEFVSIFSGKTPCEDQPLARTVKTDSKGVFIFTEVPVGRYGIVIQGTDGKWVRYGSLSTKLEVKSGETTDIEKLDVAKK